MVANDDNQPDPPSGPGERTPDPEAQTRRTLAVMIFSGFSLIALLVVIGGMVGKFDQTLVDAVVTAMAGSAATVAYFFFHNNQLK
jgi:hypothetical protein